MRITDKYLVKISSKHETEFKLGTLVLERPSLSDRIEGSDGKTCSYNPDMYLTKQGIVSELPHSLSSTPARFANFGLPQHSRYISSEMIETSGGGLDRTNYNPSTYSDQSVKTNEVFAVEAEVGDIAHFYHTAIDKKDPLTEDLYAVNVSEVFAYERNGVLFPCKGYVLCSRIKKEAKSNGGLTLAHKNEDLVDRGVVEFAHTKSEIRVTDTVFHKKHADYNVDIKGREFFVLREYDCLSVTSAD